MKTSMSDVIPEINKGHGRERTRTRTSRLIESLPINLFA